MKKTLISLILVFGMALSLSACGDGDKKPAESDASGSASASEPVEAEGKTVSGRVDEVKDFMFVIEAEDGCFYAFDTDKLPEGTEVPGYADLVTITYEGELSEVDNFTGKILSLEVTGTVGAVPTIDGAPLEFGDNGYVLPVAIGTEITMDLDGDGEEETILYDVTPAQEDENGYWNQGVPSTLSVNGVNFLGEDEENPMEIYGFWMENPGCESYYLVDLDARDGMVEIAIPDWGNNDWLTSYLFRYENGSLTYLGYLPNFPDQDTTCFFGDGTIALVDRLDIMQTWSGYMIYVYEDGELKPLEGQMISTADTWEPVTLRKEVTVYTQPDKSSETFVMAPSDDPVQLPMTDNEHWVQIISGDGTEGWLYFSEGIMLENGDEVVKAEEVFSGLVYAG